MTTLNDTIKCRPFYAKDNEAITYSLDTLLEDINEQNHKKGGGLCEYIKEADMIRFYLDLDCKDIETEDKLNEIEQDFKYAISHIKGRFKEHFGSNLKICVASYKGKQFEDVNFKNTDTGKYKLSAHIHFPTIIIPMKIAKDFFEDVQKSIPEDKRKYLDGSVYGPNRSIFRLPFARKGNCDKSMILEFDQFKNNIRDFVITWYDKNDDLIYPQMPEKIEPQQFEKPVIISVSQKKYINKSGLSLKNEWLETIRPVLMEVLPIEDIDNYTIWHSQIGQGLYNMFKDDGKELFREVSMRSLDKYDEVSFEDNWSKYEKAYDPERVNKKMWGGILDIAKKRNPNHHATKSLEDLVKKELNEIKKQARRADKEAKDAELLDLEEVLNWIKSKSMGNIILKADTKGKDISHYVFNEKLGYWRLDTLYCLAYIKDLLIELSNETEQKYYKSLQMRNAVEHDLHTIFRNEEIIFDNHSNFLPFQNGILDLSTGDFIPHDKKYYISLVLPYNYEKLDNQSIQSSHLWQILKKIFVDEESRKFALACYATSLIGECIQHIFICSGKGGNGKGVLNRLNASALEYYSIKGNSALLTQEKKAGACPEMANLANKRFVVFQEVEGRGFQNAILKDLTGGDKIDARGLYDSNTSKKNCMSMFIESNDVPKLNKPPQDAEKRRMKMLEFNSKFSKDFKEDNYEKLQFVADDNIDSDTWRQQNRNIWINILLPYAIDFLKNRVIDTPKSAQNAINKYFISCDNITEFLDAILDPSNEKDYVPLKQIFDDIYKNHESYHKLNVVQQRKSTYQNFIKSVEKSSIYSSAFDDSSHKRGKAILGYKLKPIEEYQDFLVIKPKVQNPLLLDD